MQRKGAEQETRPDPPKRDKLEAAEAALQAATKRHAKRIAAIEARREAIEAELAALRKERDKEVAPLERNRDQAEKSYREALVKWGR